jgi:hypothetical protein
MENIIDVVKKLFLPKFTYTYQSALPNKDYINNIASKLKSMNANIIDRNTNYISFYIKSSVILGKPALGKYLIYIENVDGMEHIFKIQFSTTKSIYYSISSIISLLVIIGLIRNDNIFNLLAIPLLFLWGHVVFWGFLPTKIQKIKLFFLNLD